MEYKVKNIKNRRKKSLTNSFRRIFLLRILRRFRKYITLDVGDWNSAWNWRYITRTILGLLMLLPSTYFYCGISYIFLLSHVYNGSEVSIELKNQVLEWKPIFKRCSFFMFSKWNNHMIMNLFDNFLNTPIISTTNWNWKKCSTNYRPSK